MYCACRSVAKPGYSSVVMSTDRIGPLLCTRKVVPSGCVTARPVCRSFRINASRCSTGHSEAAARSEEHTSELQSRGHLVCRLLLEKKKIQIHDLHCHKRRGN